jgi:high affinity Mn2+ porin
VSGADGRFETYEFTDVDRSLSAGLSLGGARWGRPDDVVAAAGVMNEASKDRRLFLADGGLGILIGDGRLPRARPESILEGRYEVRLTKIFRLGLDSQWIANPGYNRDRGPVAVFAFRLHAEL